MPGHITLEVTLDFQDLAAWAVTCQDLRGFGWTCSSERAVLTLLHANRHFAQRLARIYLQANAPATRAVPAETQNAAADG